jgi:ParB family transcriptional regulator, chromosome partitioning protein
MLSFSRLEDKRLVKFERQLSERDRRLAGLTEQLSLKSTLLGQAEANGRSASEAAKRAGQELVMQTSLVKQTQARLRDTQTRLTNTQAELDKILLSRNQQNRQYENELANVRAELEAKKSELEAVHLQRLAHVEYGWTSLRRRARADSLCTVTTASLVDSNEDPQATETDSDVASIWSKSDIEAMENRNEG